jgi:hypothetical protein
LALSALAMRAAGLGQAFSRGLSILVLAAACLPWQTAQAASSEIAEEAQVKAAYLHKFPGFVEWPESVISSNPSAPFVIGVAGAEAIYTQLAGIVPGRLVQGRHVEVRRVVDAKAAQSVHVLFIGREYARYAPAWIATVADHPILTVVEDIGLQSRAILNFVVRDGNVRFEASVNAANKAGLKLSSRLLAVAAHVEAK